MRQERILKLKDTDLQKGPVVYWMSRDQRMNDNWALLYAQEMALEFKAPLLVAFCLVPEFLGATLRQYGFMLEGLSQLQENLAKKNISFDLLFGLPQEEIPKFTKKHKAGLLVTDFDPLRIKRQWRKKIVESVKIPFHEVDAHNIVPCWEASPKQEFGAYTLRPKIHRALDSFLEEFPGIKRHPFAIGKKGRRVPVPEALSRLNIDERVAEVGWLKPGEKAAKTLLRGFIKKKLNHYSTARNDPNKDGQSNLSPYLHFGQISAQRVTLDIIKSKLNTAAQEDFLEELIVRRELSDNFCFYNKNYDSFSGTPRWAHTTLSQHKSDKRAYLYSLKELEQSETHDELWNAAQREMVKTGKMHGYMRMYWAKKILEWTKSPEEAFHTAIYLNDKYELDGRDPNGYAGIAWSIGGVHDRAWGERAVFGKVRYMSFNGCKSKFDVSAYVEKIKKI